MSRQYRCRFVSDYGDVATVVGHGNTKDTAERSARRNLPTSESRKVMWTLRAIEYIAKVSP